MATTNIFNVFPVEIFEHIFSLLSKFRSDISACRLTCRAFHSIISPYLVPSVTVANSLDVLHRTQRIIRHPYFSRHVKELIYVQGRYERPDEIKFDSGFVNMAWERMDEEERLLWQVLRRYSDYPGPERFRGVRRSAFDQRSLEFWPDFHDYIWSIKMNMLEELLETLPSLRHVIFMDFRSGRAEGLVRSMHEWDTFEDSDLYWGEAYGDGDEFGKLIFLVGVLRDSEIKGITVGPHLFQNSMAYWEQCRDETGLVGMAGPSYHLNLAVIDELWNDQHDEVKAVVRGLRRLHLPIELYESDKATLLTTLLPSFVELATPSLTHLTLDAKGVIRDGAPRDDLGLLGFESFFGKLHMPHLIQFDLLGWVYTQAQLQRFLVRHAGPLRELRLMHNIMLEGDVVTLADFCRDRLSLTGIELDWGVDRRETPEDVNMRDGPRSSLSMPERWLEPQWQSPSFALELRWLGGRSNQIVRARQWHCDQYMSSSTLE